MEKKKKNKNRPYNLIDIFVLFVEETNWTGSPTYGRYSPDKLAQQCHNHTQVHDGYYSFWPNKFYGIISQAISSSSFKMCYRVSFYYVFLVRDLFKVSCAFISNGWQSHNFI